MHRRWRRPPNHSPRSVWPRWTAPETSTSRRTTCPTSIACENGGADFAALQAQAVAARSYLYYKIGREGRIGDGQGDQVYSCGRGPGQEHIDAAASTAGQVLTYHDAVIAAFYVAGAIPSTDGLSPGGRRPRSHGHGTLRHLQRGPLRRGASNRPRWAGSTRGTGPTAAASRRTAPIASPSMATFGRTSSGSTTAKTSASCRPRGPCVAPPPPPPPPPDPDAAPPPPPPPDPDAAPPPPPPPVRRRTPRFRPMRPGSSRTPSR
jgi:hypothetical protein